MLKAQDMTELFDAVEELTGTEPSGIDLRSGIHAMITKNMDLDARTLIYRKVGSTEIMLNMEYLARNYEACRVTSQTIGGGN